MKTKLLMFVIGLIASSICAQIQTTDLPSFYNKSDGMIRSVDLGAHHGNPVVIYTTYLRKGVHCKKWNGAEWEILGEFPEIKDRGYVNIEDQNGLKALVQSGENWLIYELDETTQKWTKQASIDLSGNEVLSDPTFVFNNGNPFVYEHHYRTGELNIFAKKGDKIEEVSLDNKDRISYTFFYTYSTTLHSSIMGWLDEGRKPEIYFVNEESESSKKIKGINKKEVSEIIDLREYQGDLYLFWLNKSWDLRCGKYNVDLDKWEIIENAESMEAIGYTCSNDLSFLSIDRDSKLCVYNKFNGKNWEKGETLGTSQTELNKELMLIKIGDSNYWLAHDLEGNCRIRKF
ncbi:MAG: hypothetical protein MK212_06620 [Saprospiraceae bacterium]|nr:hypothetical protein [Saprospiraceae bacterium]